MSVITKLENGTEIDDTFVTSIDNIMILKAMIGDDKVFDKNHEFTEYGNTKLKKLQKKWCLENQKDNYNNTDYKK
tara:strand:- start:463 stop:687 length:225 start_codon:yes stop_codon:yes gene_type:complete